MNGFFPLPSWKYHGYQWYCRCVKRQLNFKQNKFLCLIWAYSPIDWLTDSLTHGFMNSVIDWMIDWFIHLFIWCFSHSLSKYMFVIEADYSLGLHNERTQWHWALIAHMVTYSLVSYSLHWLYSFVPQVSRAMDISSRPFGVYTGKKNLLFLPNGLFRK